MWRQAVRRFAHVSAGQAKSGDALTRSKALFYEADVGRGTPRWFTGATRHEESGFYRRLRRIIRLVGQTRAARGRRRTASIGESTVSAKKGSWTEVELAGHPCDVFEPCLPSEHGYVVLYLHGVHSVRLVDNPVFTGLFDRHGLRVIAPMTGPSWWSDRICDAFDAQLTAEQHVLGNVVSYVQKRWNAVPPRIALLGTSMGGQGALRFAFKYPDTFPIVAAISPAIDYQWRLEEGDPVLEQMYGDPETARQYTATLHIHPLNWPRNTWFACDPADWPWYESAERLQMKLTSLGVPHECDLETEAGGHGFEYYNHIAENAIGFILQRLEVERLRIV